MVGLAIFLEGLLMAQYTDSFGLGATQIAVPAGISLNVQVIPPRACNGWFFKWVSGGTLAIVNGNGITTAAGYIVGTTEVVQASGPAVFWLAASGSTSVLSFVASYSSGYSLLP